MNAYSIKKIVAEVIGADIEILEDDSRLGQSRGWDSIAQLEIIERLETMSGKKLSIEESIFAESLLDLYSLFKTEEH